MKSCTANRCKNIHYAKGYCNKHYKQVRVYGKPFTKIEMHNSTHSVEYKTYASMLSRVRYHSRYKDISVCDRWLESFRNFLSDMGERPEGMSLDRIDNNGDYSPENCRWATRQQQQENRSTTVFIEYEGRRLSATGWSKEIGVSSGTIAKRLRKGLPIETVLSRQRINSKGDK